MAKLALFVAPNPAGAAATTSIQENIGVIG